MTKPLTLVAIALASLSACRTTKASEPTQAPTLVTRPTPEMIQLTIVGTNDVHGWVFPHKTRLHSGDELEEGGLATFGGYLAILRGRNPGRTLLLDAGDMFQGTLVSNRSEGAVVISAFNQLGYQAAAVGNHDFDYGPLGPISVATDPAMDPFGALKARILQAKFPILSANTRLAASGQHPDWLPDDGTTIVELKGLKVGVIGLTTTQTPVTTNPINVAQLKFGPLADEAVAAAKRLRERGAQVVVVTMHAGGKCASLEDPRDTSSCDVHDGELFPMLDKLPEGTIDAVVAGHTHQTVGHFIHGTPAISTTGMGMSFGTIDLFYDDHLRAVDQRFTQIHAAIPICSKVDEESQSCEASKLAKSGKPKLVDATFYGQKVVPDAQVTSELAPALAWISKEQEKKLNLSAPKPLHRRPDGESPLGDVVADGLRAMEKADVALINSGGLRWDLPAGDLTYGDVYQVFPFDNNVATATLDGDELLEIIRAAFERRRIFQQSGLLLTLTRCQGRTKVASVALVGGKPIAKDGTYKLATTDFIALGGDGMGPVFAKIPKGRLDVGINRPQPAREELIAHWQSSTRELTAPEPGRSSFVQEAGCQTSSIE